MAPSPTATRLPGAELVWFDRSGKRLSSAAPPGEYNTMCTPPNGNRIVYELADPATGNIDLWTLDLATSATTQLTFAGPVEFYPVCAPDGRDMVFAALKPNVPNLYRQSILAPGNATLLLTTPFAKIPSIGHVTGGCCSTRRSPQTWGPTLRPAARRRRAADVGIDGGRGA